MINPSIKLKIRDGVHDRRDPRPNDPLIRDGRDIDAEPHYEKLFEVMPIQKFH
jgi:hypothetical protein